MAKRIETQFVDDLDGSKADETVELTLGKDAYEFDLSKKNATAFYLALAPYIEVARHVRKSRGPVKSNRVRAPKAATNGNAPLANTPELRAQVRAWAAANPDLAGMPVGDRGRIAESVMAAYAEHALS